MTVNELAKLVAKAKRAGRGNEDVLLMIVEEGITCAQKITGGEIAESYDGKMLWLYPDDEVIPPSWTRGNNG